VEERRFNYETNDGERISLSIRKIASAAPFIYGIKIGLSTHLPTTTRRLSYAHVFIIGTSFRTEFQGRFSAAAAVIADCLHAARVTRPGTCSARRRCFRPPHTHPPRKFSVSPEFVRDERPTHRSWVSNSTLNSQAETVRRSTHSGHRRRPNYNIFKSPQTFKCIPRRRPIIGKLSRRVFTFYHNRTGPAGIINKVSPDPPPPGRRNVRNTYGEISENRRVRIRDLVFVLLLSDLDAIRRRELS